MSDGRTPIELAVRAARRYGIALLAVLLVIAGLLLLAVPAEPSSMQASIGTTLLATGSLSIGWRLLVERWEKPALRQLIEHAVASRSSSTDLGLMSVSLSGFDAARLSAALSEVDTLRATCLYDGSWTETAYTAALTRFLQRQGHKAESCVPDPTDLTLMEILAHRHQVPADVFKSRVDSLISHLEKLSEELPGRLRVIRIRVEDHLTRATFSVISRTLEDLASSAFSVTTWARERPCPR